MSERRRISSGSKFESDIGYSRAVVDGGNPVGPSSTVKADGSLVAGGGVNPVSGYSLIEAADLNDAHQKAKGCPLLKAGGTIEIAQAFDM